MTHPNENDLLKPVVRPLEPDPVVRSMAEGTIKLAQSAPDLVLWSDLTSGP